MPVPTPTLTSAGKKMDATYQIVSIDVSLEVNRVPFAEVRLIDGDAAQQTFVASNAAFFEPGALVEIKMRYEGGEDAPLFKGYVVRHALEAGPDGSQLIVGLKDAAVKLTTTRQSAVYTGKSDQDIFKALLGAADVASGTLESTSPKHPTMVQYDCSAWDFIVMRAEALGMIVSVDLGKVSVGPMVPNGGGGPKHTFNWGVDEVIELDFAAEALHPFKSVETAAWDAGAVALTDPKSTSSATVKLPGNLDADKMASMVGRNKAALVHPVPMDKGETEAWANATLSRSQLATLRGRIAVPGRGNVKLLDSLQIKGVGERFNGKTHVTGIRHRYDAEGWRTDVQFGLSPERHCERKDITSAPAGGLLSPARGLRIGKVAGFEDDPQKELRVKVLLPGVDDKPSSTVWARLASPDAGPLEDKKARGFFFRPEVNDEVIVGFLQDDPRYPVILGSLYGQATGGPEALMPLSDKNEKKGFVTKKGTTIAFIDADKPSIYIETAAKNRIVLDEAAQGISLLDQNGNKIILDPNGITIEAAKGKNVAIKGAQVDVS